MHVLSARGCLLHRDPDSSARRKERGSARVLQRMSSRREQRKSYGKEDFLADVAECDSLIQSYIPSPAVGKSSEKAACFRSSGSLLFADRKYEDAILIYNLAILNAEFDEAHEKCIEAALSLSNRGMCYYHLGLVKQALLDLQSAQSLGYPDDVKIEKRRSLYASKLLDSELKPQREDRRPPQDPPYTVFLTTDAGRGLKANRLIKAGELVLADPAYAAMLELDRLDAFCYHCIRRIQRHQFFPCVSCTQVRYCSIKCSVENYLVHKYECGHLDLIKQNLSSNSAAKLLSMKIILSTNPDQVLSDVQKGDDGQKTANDYSNMMRLVDHDSDAHILNRETAFLTSFIMSRHTGYRCLHPDQQLLLAHKLLKHARQTSWNAMSISFRSLTPSDFNPQVMNLREDTIGVGVFFKQLLINHSCDPNIQTCGFDGDKVYLQAIKDIESGEEILNSYGVFSKWQSYEHRQSYLSQNYKFTCRCNACSQKKEPLIRAYKCPAINCNGPVVDRDCLVCRRQITNEEVLAIRGEVLSANQAISAGIKFLNEYLQEQEDDVHKFAVMEKIFRDAHLKFKKHLYRDHRDVIMTQDTICSFYMRAGAPDRGEAAVDCGVRLLKDTRRVFDEDVHLLNTMIKVIHCLRKFAQHPQHTELKAPSELMSNAHQLLAKILPANSEEINTLTQSIAGVAHSGDCAD